MIALSAVSAAAFAFYFWHLAAGAAARRRLALGSLPVWLLAACAAAGGATSLAYHVPGSALLALAVAGTLVCGLVDARTGFIFDPLTIGVALVMSVAAALCGQLWSGCVAACTVGGLLLCVYWVTGRRGIGLGDVKLAAAMAIGLGPLWALIAIGSSFILGAAYGSALLALGRARRTDALRFGPFIAGGVLVAVLSNAAGVRL